MTNLSFLSKALIASGLAAILFATSVATAGQPWDSTATMAAAVGLLCVLVSMYFVWQTHLTVLQARDVCHEVAQGNFEARIVGIRDSGDLGATLLAVNEMIDLCDAYVRESAAAMTAVRNNKYFRHIREEGMHGALLSSSQIINAAMDAIAQRVGAFHEETGKFEDSIRLIVETVSQTSDNMGTTAGTLSQGAAATAERVSSVAAATDDATVKMQAIAAACTQLTSSAKEIGQQVGHSAQIARDAVVRASEASDIIASMTAASERIGSVAEMISGIAVQTNLLALNATIEAAHAGEAGRGFAVVASEVKSLADQTSGATAQIAAQIGEVQNATRAAVDIIAQIGRIVSDVDATTKQVADAVDAQGLATNEIAGHVEQAFTGFRGITENIHGVTENVSQTEGLAKTTSSASGELSVQARRLSSQVSEFVLALHRGPLDRRQSEEPGFKDKERRTRAT